MKYLLLFLITATLWAGDITGYSKYQLGKTLGEKTTETGDCPNFWQKKNGNPRIMVYADKDKKIYKIVVSFGYKQDYEYKTPRAAYARLVEASIKKYGKGVGRTESKSRDDKPTYEIAKDGRSVHISINGPYIHVLYTFKPEAEYKKPEGMDEDI